MAPFGTRREAADRKICCAGLTRWLNATAPLVERTWTVLDRGSGYHLRDLDGQPITERAAKALIAERYTVDADVRARARAHSAATHRAKLTR